MDEITALVYEKWIQRVPIRIILQDCNLTQKEFDTIRYMNDFPERERAAGSAKKCDPTQAEIEDACRQLRAGWSEKQEISRMRGKKDLDI